MISVFPDRIDNSIRKVLVKCQKAAHYRYELGLQSKDAKRVDLVAGKAFAAGIAAVRTAYHKSKKAADAQMFGVKTLYESYADFQCPKDSNKTADKTAGALVGYLAKYQLYNEKIVPLELDGKLCVEMYFEFPMGVIHPVTGEELFYCGNFDMLGVDTTNGDIWVVDEKTTSSMGEKWANQWPLDGQMTGYCWGARRLLALHGIDPARLKGAIINGIAIKKYDYEYGRFPTYREDWEIERWFAQVKKDVVDWKEAFLRHNHNYNLDHSCAYYNNPCEFVPLCKSKNPERIMEGGQYVVEFWDPRNRT